MAADSWYKNLAICDLKKNNRTNIPSCLPGNKSGNIDDKQPYL